MCRLHIELMKKRKFIAIFLIEKFSFPKKNIQK